MSPRQNRVDPWGRLNAVPDRGAWMGNRGILHNDSGEVVAPWRHKAWVTCVLEYKGRRREIFSPRRYSELFFLDEAAALSAGHRPCAFCRRERFNEFKALWCKANLDGVPPSSVPAPEMDRRLHSERAVRGGGKATFRAKFETLPRGTFIEHEGEAFLIWEGRLLKWSFSGYSPAAPADLPSGEVNVLTPASIVAVLRLGFLPQVHESAKNPAGMSK